MRRLALSAFIFGVCVFAVEHYVGWDELASAWWSLDDPVLLLVAPLLLGCTYLIRALRVYRYLRLKRGFGRCLRVLVQHTMLVNLLPMRAGELAFPALMKRHFGMSMQRSLPALLWLRILDLHVLFSVPLLVLVALPGTADLHGAVALAVGWLACLPAVFVLSRAMAAYAASRGGALMRVMESVLNAVPASPRALLEDWLLTAANWFLKLCVFAWIIRMFSSQGYVTALAGAIGGELGSLLPVQGMGGFGTYEAGAVAAMRLFGTSTSDALAGALNLHLLVLGTSVCAACLALLLPGRSRAAHADQAGMPPVAPA